MNLTLALDLADVGVAQAAVLSEIECLATQRMNENGLFIEANLGPAGEAAVAGLAWKLWAVACLGPPVGAFDGSSHCVRYAFGEQALVQGAHGAAFVAGRVTQQHQRLFRRVV